MQSDSQVLHQKMFKTLTNTFSSTYSQFRDESLLIDAYQQVLNLQVKLINELIFNKRLIMQFLAKSKARLTKSKAKSTDVGTQKFFPSYMFNSCSESQNPSSRKIQKFIESESSSVKKQRKKKRISKKVSSSSCYNPSSENSMKNMAKTIRETKHIPKNYGKAIINFMLKNIGIVEQLCNKNGKDIKEFWKVVQQIKSKIYTVANLKSMWLEASNPFGKIFRIVSMLYLRKHSLEHIFNSRVENFARHIKYRYRIIEAVKNPESFCRIKEY